MRWDRRRGWHTVTCFQSHQSLGEPSPTIRVWGVQILHGLLVWRFASVMRSVSAEETGAAELVATKRATMVVRLRMCILRKGW
jgi:hypothetical protein